MVPPDSLVVREPLHNVVDPAVLVCVGWDLVVQVDLPVLVPLPQHSEQGLDVLLVVRLGAFDELLLFLALQPALHDVDRLGVREVRLVPLGRRWASVLYLRFHLNIIKTNEFDQFKADRRFAQGG